MSDRAGVSAMLPMEPAAAAAIQENISTTIVRSAVAKSESVFRMPHLARIAVMPAKNADNIAIISHIGIPSIARFIVR